MRCLALVNVLTLAALPPALAETHHVCADASGDFPTIQAAVDAAASGDTIELCDGTFTGPGNWDVTFGTKDLVLRSRNGNEATTIDCGYRAARSIHGTDLPGANAIDLDTRRADVARVPSSSGTEFHRGMILEGGQTSATEIAGITIRNARWDGDGGAIRCVGSSPIIRNVRIEGCAGGSTARGVGIFVESGAPTIENCVLTDNLGSGSLGTAIYSRGGGISLRRCVVQLNFSASGAVDLDAGDLDSCTFLRNMRVGDVGHSVNVEGGFVSFRNCLFAGSFSSAIALASGAEVFVESSIFEDLEGHGGTGLRGTGAATVRGCTFRRNATDTGPSVIDLEQGPLVLERCVFLDNHATYLQGGTVSFAGSSLQVLGCTFAKNRSHSRASGLVVGAGTAVTIDHTILVFGESTSDEQVPAIACTGTVSAMDLACTNIFGNDGGDWVGCIDSVSRAGGNLSADPLFCDLRIGDVEIDASSPCAPDHSDGCELIGALGVACESAAVEARSWGAIKSLYR